MKENMSWTELRHRVLAFELRDDEPRGIDYYRTFLDCLPKDAVLVGFREDRYTHDRRLVFVASSFFPVLHEGEICTPVKERITRRYEPRPFGGEEMFEDSEWRWCL